MKKLLTRVLSVAIFIGIAAGVSYAAQLSSNTYKELGYNYDNHTKFYQDSARHAYKADGDKATISKDSATYHLTFADGDGEGLYTYSAAGLTTSTTLLNIAQFEEDGVRLAYEANATQTLDIDMDATGLDIGGDQTADDGYELFSGAFGASGRPLVVGVDEAFQFCVSFTVEDVSGSDVLRAGFRQVGGFAADPDDYVDAASLGWDAAANPAAIDMFTIDGGAATTTTDTTDTLADATATTWCVKVSDAGVVTYTIDSVAPTVAAAFTFDTGAMLVPYFTFIQDTALTGYVYITEWEVKFQ